ncbi:condensation domain-containing protein [Saccharopolyspora hattusasensis]|uniref:condensation domain-containing protein n=1 Tax=Saccharopolyspora hattusasensis TaxID=1128679 RepID=UPI003D95488C
MIPLSFAQQRLWFLHRMEGRSATYNVPYALRLNGKLDVAALRRALDDVLARHESLRTRIAGDQDEPRQLIVENKQVPWQHRKVEAERLVDELREAAGQPFDLAREIPIRAWLFQTDAEEYVLLLLLHHIAVDGWSLGLLARDMGQAYAARCVGVAPAWAPLPVQYADYTLWQRELLGEGDDGSSVLARQREYWLRQLAGLPDAIDLPADRRRPPVQSHRGDYLDVDRGRQVRPERQSLGGTGRPARFRRVCDRPVRRRDRRDVR